MLGIELKGRYRIIKALGFGGFGKTYLAEDTHRPGAPYCVVKQLMPLCKDLEFLQMARRLFKMEAETLEKLGKHNQIPQLLAYFEEDEEFYLVEEFIEGHCFKRELTQGKRFPDFEVVDFLKNIAEILDFIHKQGVIHRDIKPSNIIRREQDGRLILIDFGAVKQIQPHLLREQENITLTTLTIAIGTADYAPLEQLAGQPRFNSDIYALGIVGIEARTGILPNQLKRDSQTGKVIWHHLAQVREDLAEILDKMTHPVFVERYQSAIAVLQDLEKLEHSNSAIALSTIPPTNASVTSPLTISPTITFTSPSQTKSHYLVLSAEQHVQIEKILKEFVGPIGPILLQQSLTQVSSAKELVDNLLLHLPQNQHLEFQRRSIASLQKELIVQTQPRVPIPPTLKAQAINDSFVNRCQQELTDLIGPMGTLIVQRTIRSHPQFSLEEFVETLAAKIPNPQKATEFRRRLLS